MFEVPNPDLPANTVVQVVQTGYVIGERVLRPVTVDSVNHVRPHLGAWESHIRHRQHHAFPIELREFPPAQVYVVIREILRIFRRRAQNLHFLQKLKNGKTAN